MLDQKIQKKVDDENRELAYVYFGFTAIGFLGLLGIVYGIESCQAKSELQKQYDACQYLLRQAQSEESKRFVYDEVFAVSGEYKGKTCREIIDLYQK